MDATEETKSQKGARMTPEQVKALRNIVGGIKEDSSAEELQVAVEELVELVQEIPDDAMMAEDEAAAPVEDEDAFRMDAGEEDAEKSAIRALRRALGLKSWHGKEQALDRLNTLNVSMKKAGERGVSLSAKGLANVYQQYQQVRDVPVTAPAPKYSASNAPVAKKSSANISMPNVNLGAKEYPMAQMVADMAGMDFAQGEIRGRKSGQNYEVGTLGGYVVRQDIREEILPQLRDRLVVEKAGAVITQTPDDAVILLPKMTKSTKAQWVGVNQEVTSSEAEFQQITLKPKPLAALARIPIRMLNTMPSQAEQRIRTEIVKSLQLGIDYACFFGQGAVTSTANDFQIAGSGEEPLGLLNISGVTNVSLGTDGGKASPDSLNTALAAIEAENVEWERPGHITNSQISSFFFSLTDTTGQPNQRVQRTGRSVAVDGIDVYATNFIPQNVTTGASDATGYIFTGNWNMMEVAIGSGIEVKVLVEKYATFLQVGILAYTYADMAVHYPEAFYIQSGVTI